MCKLTKIIPKIALLVLAFVMTICMGEGVSAQVTEDFQSTGNRTQAQTLSQEEAPTITRASVKADRLKLHSIQGDTLDTHVIKTMRRGQVVTILEKNPVWYYVQCGSIKGYCMRKYLKVQKTNYEDIIAYGKKFLGNPYVWGGTSLTNGCDCSGYTQGIYRHFGYNLPRTSFFQRSAGLKVNSLKEAQPGDLICYYGHVAIYLGNDYIMHAKGRQYGIVITKGVAYRKIASIRRIV